MLNTEKFDSPLPLAQMFFRKFVCEKTDLSSKKAK